MRRMRIAVGFVGALVLCLSLAATAAAWREPTASERTAITKAAKRTPSAGNSKVSVGQIRVSTVGPWASAGVSILVGGARDNAISILHKVRGTWRFVTVGTAGEGCVMPLKDRRSLGLASYPCG